MRFRSDEVPLRNKLIERPRRASKEYEFFIGSLRTPVRIRLNVEPDHVSFETSHFVHTPEQMGPYQTSVMVAATEREALDLAVNSLLLYYKIAVNLGRKPEEAWLVPNTFFGFRP